jgi:hypothetical protein
MESQSVRLTYWDWKLGVSGIVVPVRSLRWAWIWILGKKWKTYTFGFWTPKHIRLETQIWNSAISCNFWRKISLQIVCGTSTPTNDYNFCNAGKCECLEKKRKFEIKNLKNLKQTDTGLIKNIENKIIQIINCQNTVSDNGSVLADTACTSRDGNEFCLRLFSNSTP